MDLTRLSKKELQDEFLKINARYINLSAGSPDHYMQNKEFLEVQETLHKVLDELKRRREQV